MRYFGFVVVFESTLPLDLVLGQWLRWSRLLLLLWLQLLLSSVLSLILVRNVVWHCDCCYRRILLQHRTLFIRLLILCSLWLWWLLFLLLLLLLLLMLSRPVGRLMIARFLRL